jgi:biotin carboxylase
MHIAFVDSNLAALEALRHAKEEGHRVSFIEPAEPVYPLTDSNVSLIERADWLMRNVPTANPAAVTAALAQCHAVCPIDAVTSQQEMAVEAAALACKELGLRGTAPDAVLIARRKDRLRAVLRSAGLATPRFALARDAGEAVAAVRAIGYPAVIKPPSGAGSRLTFIARGPGDTRAACREILAGAPGVPADWHEQFSRGILLEEYLSGPLISVEIGRRGRESYVFCISGRTRSAHDEVVEVGAHIPAELPLAAAAECAAYAKAVCAAIGLDNGVFHLEMIVTGEGPVLVEANPRVMGGIMPVIYRHATGQSIYASLLQIFSGAPVTTARDAVRGCVASRRLIARTDGRLPGVWDTGWLGAYRDLLIAFEDPSALGFLPGQAVRSGQMIARLMVRGADYPAASRVISDIVGRMESSLGLALMRGEYDGDLLTRRSAALPGA